MRFRKTLWHSLAVLVLVSSGIAYAAEPKPLIISFNGPSGEAYVGKFIKGIQAAAEAKGYDIEIHENQFNQTEQDQQVQQVLASGRKPAFYLWFPSDAVAGLGSLRALSRTGVPVLKINQLPNEQDTKYIVGYAGPDDKLRAANAGKMMVEAAAARKKAGATRFNVVALTYPRSYGGYQLSIDAFKAAIEGSDLELVGESNEGFGQANGYAGAAKLIAKLKNEGIDYVYGMDDAILTGGIKALEEAGLKVGSDGVVTVGTVCNGDKQLIEEGKEYGTTLQSPLHEGQLAIELVSEYLKNGKLANFLNFTPNPTITMENISTVKLDGYDGKSYMADELCSGAWSRD